MATGTLPDTSVAPQANYVLFEVAGQAYALPLTDIVEVIWMVAMTATPAHQDHIEGVINLRGSIVPLLNIRRLLRLPAMTYGTQHRILIVNTGGHMAGFVVDSVSRVREMAEAQIEQAHEFDHELEFVTGLIKVDEQIAFLIDLGRLLTARDLKAVEEVVDSAAGRTGPETGSTSRPRSKRA